LNVLRRSSIVSLAVGVSQLEVVPLSLCGGFRDCNGPCAGKAADPPLSPVTHMVAGVSEGIVRGRERGDAVEDTSEGCSPSVAGGDVAR
jgi:hypothetical protein